MSPSGATRRNFCLGLGALSLGACAPALQQTEGWRTLDLAIPADALTAMVKMRGSLLAEDVPHWYYGTIYAVLPGKPPLPMVDFEGSEIDFYERQSDGSYRAYGATVSFFRDTKTKQRLYTYDNPITGQRNIVEPNSISVKAHYVYTVNGMKRSDDPRPLPTQGSITDALDWRESGDEIWLTMRRAYPADLPMGEHQLVRGALRELHDPNTVKVYTTAAPTYISPWLRWMDMQGHEGHTVWAGPAKKLDSVEQYPRELLEFMEKNYPEKLTAKPA